VRLAKQKVQTDPDQDQECQSEQRHKLRVNANLSGRQSFEWRETPTSWSCWRHRDDPSASDEKQQPFADEKAKQFRKALQNGENELTYDLAHVRASLVISGALSRFLPKGRNQDQDTGRTCLTT
jgi:hypothetical protein